MTALQNQIGGKHYCTLAMQPVELAAMLNLNGFELNIVKYLSRYKSKNGLADIEKTEHYFDLMHDLGVNQVRWWQFYLPAISKSRLWWIIKYCELNEIGPYERALMIYALEWWHPSALPLRELNITDCFNSIKKQYTINPYEI
jgi:hypothetical protein